ncbi:MAG TPA: DUF2203 domain-containing protein [Methylomirabilota bacterium]|nr:DUF2203 domain-containing protein [Methylomirabilota bacterium]
MTQRLFTPAEVDALIPRLAELMGRAIERHRRAQDLAEALRAERERIRMAGGSAVDRREWKARGERLDGLTIEVRAALAEVEELGGVVKDVEMGLVDFAGRLPGAGDDPVNLCWRFGETAVRFWHGFDEGYAQRKPLP